MNENRELITEEQGVERYCYCPKCGSKAELHENSEGTLWYTCTECWWFGLKYSGGDKANEIEEIPLDSSNLTCQELNGGVLSLGTNMVMSGKLIQSDYKINIKEKCEYCEADVDYRIPILGRYDNDCYFEYFYIDDNNHLTNGDVIHDKLNYCPMCGRKL